ncbi:MAG: M1 family metallopeptidase [Phycisphaerae bacterium]|nr:M1 family metallopeptidase [Phycisphaerae bacterium]
MPRLVAPIGLFLAFAAVPGLAAEPDPRIDADTGRQKAIWIRPLEWDQVHMRLDLDLADMGTPRFTARQTLRVTPIGEPRSAITLDAVDLDIAEVRHRGGHVPFDYDRRTITVRLPAPVEPGRQIELDFAYSWAGPKDFGGDGLIWTLGKPEGTNRTQQAAQIHTQGQPEANRTWFIGHDFPNDRLTTELHVTAEAPYQAVSNGRLVSVKDAKPASGKPRRTWHWLQDKPHASYLVVLVVGDFAVVDLGGPDSARPGLPMHVYTEHGEEERTRAAFANTPRMVAYFERVFDEPYPWDKYDQLIVRNFAWGGMENTSATVLNRAASFGRNVDGLIAHELGHQWTGDLITCKSWEHLWLNEGWATYAEMLWAEEKAGDDPNARRRAYHRAVIANVRAQRVRNRGSAPGSPPMVSNRYLDPNDTFVKADDVYAKGGLILHMLRARLGDEVFFEGVRTYVDRFKFRSADTDDFRRVFEEVSGQSLALFFEQWAFRPGLPSLEVDLAWDGSAGALSVSVEQTQTIDRLNPPYRFTLPVRVRVGGQDRWGSVDVEDRLARATVRFPDAPGRPTSVQIDPNLTVIARTRVRTPLPEGPD